MRIIIYFNDETLWSGGPYNPNSPNGPEILKQVRESVLKGDYVQATKQSYKLGSIPERVQQYQLMGIWELNFENQNEIKVKNYCRKLSMDSALVTVSYRIGKVNYKREIFASYPDQVIVMRVSASSPGKININTTLKSLQPSAQTFLEDNEIIMRGTAKELTENSYKNHVIPSKIKWQSQLKILTDGGRIQQSDSGNFLAVKDDNSVVFILAGATNWVSWNNTSANEQAKCDQYINHATLFTFDELRQKHLNDYIPLFSACSLDLGENKSSRLNTTERLKRLRKGETDPLFISQYFQYGRYLLLAAARENTLAFNNHNIWLNKMVGRWDGRWTLNINLEECYWPVENTNLPSVNGSLLKFVENLAAAGNITAKELYGCKGWCAHHGTDVWFNTAPTCGDPCWATWPLGGAWLMQQLYSHYEYGLDRGYLKQIYPLLKGSAQFFLDFLIEDPATKWMVTCPSTSPENSFYTPTGEEASVSMGTSMDNQIIRDLFRNTINATKILQCDETFCSELEAMLKKLPPHQIGKYGQLQEWLFDFDEVEPQHRHLSHLYACYPDDDISVQKNPQLAEAVKVVLQRRGDRNLGWSGAWKINLLARLGEGNAAYNILKNTISAVSLHPQPDDSNVTPSFEGNQGIQGITAGIAEMLMQSHSNEIYLLPALPSAWNSGKISGLRGNGGFLIDIEWKHNKLYTAKLRSLSDRECCVRTKTPVVIRCNGELIALEKSEINKYLFEVKKGQDYILSLK